MSVHPEDAHSYSVQLHDDLEALTAAVSRVAAVLEAVLTTTPTHTALEVRGLIVTREDRP